MKDQEETSFEQYGVLQLFLIEKFSRLAKLIDFRSEIGYLPDLSAKPGVGQI